MGKMKVIAVTLLVLLAMSYCDAAPEDKTEVLLKRLISDAKFMIQESKFNQNAPSGTDFQTTVNTLKPLVKDAVGHPIAQPACEAVCAASMSTLFPGVGGVASYFVCKPLCITALDQIKNSK